MKVKICGLTRPEEAEYLNAYGADLAGFVLCYPRSRRNISIDRAMEIRGRLSKHIKSVAVTVSPTIEQASEICDYRFDLIQIHGDIPDGYASLPNKLPIIKAFNVHDLGDYGELLKNSDIAGFVFDAATPGSGVTFDWDAVTGLKRMPGLLYILSGGLTPDNVSIAISHVHPDIVDVSSGVEYDAAPADQSLQGFRGKDPEKIRAFISAAKQ